MRDSKDIEQHDTQDQSVENSKPNHFLKGITIHRLVVAERVKMQRPLGVNTSFHSRTARIWGFVEVDNLFRPHIFRFEWTQKGETRGQKEFKVGRGSSWKSWTNLALRPTDIGLWTLTLSVISDQGDHHTVAQTQFQITESNITESDVTLNQIDAQQLIQKVEQVPTQSKSMQSKNEGIQSTLTKIASNPLTNESGKKGVTTKVSPPLTLILPEESVSTNRSTQRSTQSSQEKSTNTSLLSVRTLLIASGIRHRRPLKPGKRFSHETERVWGYIEVKNTGKPSLLWMEWWHKDTRRSRLKVRIGQSHRWRTWSWQRLSRRDVGQWVVKVIDENQNILLTEDFEIYAGP